MAKQLLIVRHAKSDWGNSSLDDFDRPLNKRGHAMAPEMAQRLVNLSIHPELIVSSPALRAITTAKYFASAWKIPVAEIKEEPNIYEARFQNLLNVINQFDNRFDRIAFFGHNPGLTDLVNYFDGHIDNLPTCGIVLLEFPFDDWALLSNGTGKVLLFDYPKNGDD